MTTPKPPAPSEVPEIKRKECNTAPPKAEVREFWIAENWEGATVFTDEEAAGNWYDSVYKEDSLRHVILYSAYLALKAELENQKIKSEEEYRKLEHLHALTRVELKRVKAELVEAQSKAEIFLVPETTAEHRKRLFTAYEELTAANERAKGLVESGNKVLFALQCMIIKWNGAVPGLTEQEVWDGAILARNEFKKALLKYKGEL